MAAAIVPHRQDYLPGPQSATRILVTFAPYTGRGRANRMVLPPRTHQGGCPGCFKLCARLGLDTEFPTEGDLRNDLGWTTAGIDKAVRDGITGVQIWSTAFAVRA